MTGANECSHTVCAVANLEGPQKIEHLGIGDEKKAAVLVKKDTSNESSYS